ncbi:dTDP-4-dehydrorhamnose reductase [Clostridium isatidis]|uniref:dTDP-4-dehydrorhamnose reductase n=1 Tax=Clostridium isatidis TaxID=182773 RepID=A0A343JAA5_9CLOT|nr:dTDP-4-dehydrorhamnose reductase [Clostridium isatidis]ASW42463.1 dTDP-4-dehydrorhamnose reductase [Clostridium isatidis]
MKILLTGSNGQLAKEIISVIKAGKCDFKNISNNIKDAELILFNSQELDITDMDLVKNVILQNEPDIIINCAAYTEVDLCEINEERALKVNSLGARNLAIAAEMVKAKLLHVSTDYIFSGNSKTPYSEYDIANPQTVYGKTKFLGEEYVKQYCSRYFIVRTSWLYGINGNNFVYKIKSLASKNKSIKVVNDQIGNPTNANDLAYHILKIIETNEFGIYHCTGAGECSWYDFACEIVKLYKLDCEVIPCSSDEYKTRAKRPQYSSLDNLMLRCTVGDEMRDWRKALKSFISRN